MLQGLPVIDVDSHVMEPDDLWERYIDKRFADRAPKSRRITPDYPYFAEFEFAGVKRSGVVDMSKIRFVPDGHGGRAPVTETYAHWIASGFSARSYLDYMDAAARSASRSGNAVSGRPMVGYTSMWSMPAASM